MHQKTKYNGPFVEKWESEDGKHWHMVSQEYREVRE